MTFKYWKIAIIIFSFVTLAEFVFYPKVFLLLKCLLAFIVFFDALLLKINKYESTFWGRGPITYALGVFILYMFAFPAYIIIRMKIKDGKLGLKSNTEQYSLPYSIEGKWKYYYIFCILFFLLLQIYLSLIISGFYQYIMHFAIEGLLFVMLFYFVYINNFKIEITDNKLKYKTLFSSKDLIINSISKITIRTALYNINSANFLNYYPLCIYTHNKNNKQQKLIINIKPFSSSDLKILFNEILKQKPNIELDELSVKLKQGGKQKLFNEGRKQLLLVFLLGCVFYIF